MTARRVRRLMEERRSGWVPRGLTGPTSDELRSLARDADWRFVEVVLGDVRDKRGLMQVLADSFELPSWFGGNWDAFDECFGDLVAQEEGLVLRLKGLGAVPAGLADPLVQIVAEQVASGQDAAADPAAGDVDRAAPDGRRPATPVVVVADPPLPV